MNLTLRCPNPDAWGPREQSVEDSKRITKPSALCRSRRGSGSLPNHETQIFLFKCLQRLPAALTGETELLNMANKALPGLDPNLLQPYLTPLPSLYLLQPHLPPGQPDLLTPGPLHMLLFLPRMLFSPLLLGKLSFITSSRKSPLTTHCSCNCAFMR